MHIVVGTRSIPDTTAQLELAPDGSISWGNASLIINPWDEYAVEEAVTQATAHGGTVTIIAVGPADHDTAIKHAIAMGVKQGIRLWDEAWTTLDSRGYAAAFAAAVEKLGNVDLVIFGKEAADEASDAHIFQTGRKLGWTQLSYVAEITALNESTITVTQSFEQGKQASSGPLPAVLNVMKDINAPRYPSLMGIRKAKKAVIDVWGSVELGIIPPAAKVSVDGYTLPPAKTGHCDIIEGASIAEKAAALADKLIAEKVI